MTVTVLASLSHEAWWERRACGVTDSELFRQPRLAGVAIATYCQPCPVRLECLGRALDRPKQEGVAGGLTQEDRARLWLLIEETKSTGEGAE